MVHVQFREGLTSNIEHIQTSISAQDALGKRGQVEALQTPSKGEIDMLAQCRLAAVAAVMLLCMQACIQAAVHPLFIANMQQSNHCLHLQPLLGQQEPTSRDSCATLNVDRLAFRRLCTVESKVSVLAPPAWTKLVTAAADRPRDRIWYRGASSRGPADAELVRKSCRKPTSAACGVGRGMHSVYNMLSSD